MPKAEVDQRTTACRRAAPDQPALASLGRVCRRGDSASDARKGGHLQSYRRLAARALPADYVLAENPAFVEEAWRACAAAKISIIKARELGVKMAMGSDAAHRFHHVPDGALELEYYQELGWPALEVITAATKTAAEAINRGDTLGTLTPGNVADILVVDWPVAEDVRVLRDKRNIKRMLQAGHEVALAPDRGIFGADFRATEWLDEPLGRGEPRSRAAAGRR